MFVLYIIYKYIIIYIIYNIYYIHNMYIYYVKEVLNQRFFQNRQKIVKCTIIESIRGPSGSSCWTRAVVKRQKFPKQSSPAVWYDHCTHENNSRNVFSDEIKRADDDIH